MGVNGVSANRATRDPNNRWIAGVCAGLAENWRWPVWVVRMAFLVGVLANGLGALFYLVLWLMLPLRDPSRDSRSADLGRLVAFGAVVVGLFVLASATGREVMHGWIAPLALLAIGSAIIWQQRSQVTAPKRWAIVPALLGVFLVVGGVMALVVGEVGWWQGLRFAGIALLIVGGLALLASPWLVGVYTDLIAERSARIREQERTEIATRVHDSVLQTLTLIQKNADDAAEVTRLARGESRRLRSWLYEPELEPHESLVASLQAVCKDTEQEYGVIVDLVTVGDLPWGEALDPFVAATKEAIVNAAKHAGGSASISVYCEITENSLQVFIRDRGVGFDPAEVAADRQGIRESIVGRMRRAGGSADVSSSPAGTQVTISIPLERAK